MTYYTCVEAIADHYDFYSQPDNQWEVAEVVHKYMMHWTVNKTEEVETLYDALGLTIDEYLSVSSDEKDMVKLILEKAKEKSHNG